MEAKTRYSEVGSHIQQFIDANKNDLSINLFEKLEELALVVDSLAEAQENEVTLLKKHIEELEEESAWQAREIAQGELATFVAEEKLALLEEK